MNTTEAILVLEDGKTFKGTAYGKIGETFGEAVFSTSMTGYQEVLTDPSYFKQIIVMTFPHIGNTGVNSFDNESDRVWASGFVVREPARVASNWQAEATLDSKLQDQNVVGISGIDTRALTRHLRERGAMRAGISSLNTDPEKLLAKVLLSDQMVGADLTDQVTTKVPMVVPAEGEKRFTVVAIDLGVKANTPRLMAQRGMEVHILPANSTFADITRVKPDGVFFSNGPGDPASANRARDLLIEVLNARLPYFGICFGNQIFGRALGLETYKLPFGHRGTNQPVKDLKTGHVEITTHNHGFAVRANSEFDTPWGKGRVTHLGLNDECVEGLELVDHPAFSVQFHPEAAAGAHDATHLFDRFASLMEGVKK